MVTMTLSGMSRPCALLFFAATAGTAAIARADGAAPDLKPLVEAIARHGCSQDSHYRSIGGVPCDKIGGGGDPDAALQALAAKTKEIVQALLLQTKSEDAACAKNIGGVLATAHVGAGKGSIRRSRRLSLCRRYGSSLREHGRRPSS
jgi:hypothetical protein